MEQNHASYHLTISREQSPICLQFVFDMNMNTFLSKLGLFHSNILVIGNAIQSYLVDAVC